MSSELPWFQLLQPQEIDSPALILYSDRVRDNVRAAVGMVREPSRLRPHAKTHKTREVTAMLIEAGVTQFKCATISEAEMLASSGAADVLLAYQPVGPKLRRLMALVKTYPQTQFSCLVDHPAAAAEIDHGFAGMDYCLPVYLDLDVGQHRTGIEPGPAARQLYADCMGKRGIQAVGLHAYDGHIRDKDLLSRRKHCDEAFAPVRRMQEELAHAGMTNPAIIAGGSPTFSIHSLRPEVQCSPGTFVFWDKGYLDLCPEEPFVSAALLLCRVVSLPGTGRICIDLGHKSVAAENEIGKRVFFLNAPDLRPLSQSEEHLVMETGPEYSFAPGDVLYGMPYHICPTVALYEKGFAVSGGRVTGTWAIASRDRSIGI
jgi:D-serine deaminase-like pyridoxal phosphate-dependent protein